MELKANTFATRAFKRHAGVTLIELMVSMVLSLVVVLISTSLFLSSQVTYTVNDDARTVEENGRIAIEIIARTLRQARYDDWEPGGAYLAQMADSAGIAGLDSRSLKSTSTAIDSPLTKAVNGSDVLIIRFHGAGTEDHGDGTMLNCAGFGVASSVKQNTPDGRGWSIFYVAEDSAGEPELRCKYQGKSGGWSSLAIAPGVESFQVLYGIDADKDGIPNRFLTAREVDELDDGLLLTGADSASRLVDKNRKTNWKSVVAIKVALLVRGTRNVRGDESNRIFHLFGSDYSEAYGQIDAGSSVDESKLPLTSRNRIRKIFSTTILLRNADVGGTA